MGQKDSEHQGHCCLCRLLFQFLFELSRATFQSNPVVVAPHPFIITPVSGEQLSMLELQSISLVFVFSDQAPGFQTLQQALQVRVLNSCKIVIPPISQDVQIL